jgi:diadenylate cyclase
MSEIWKGIETLFKDYVLETVKEITVINVVDILILALILFFLYRFMRDRRAGKLALGVVMISALYFLCSALDMHAMRFLFDNFYQIGIIAVLIVFQPELRAALEKVGETPFSGLKNITSESRDVASINADIESVCSAVSDLSRDKVGALIVIERTTKLGEFIKSGVDVDSVISPYILKNIFFDKAPLHDGAVIIRGNRICAAGCFLPLSTNNDINKDLATRHRAAIGLTEISDALVIVVSEETGVVSMAINGNLNRNYNYNTLKQELCGLLIPQTPEHHKKRRGGKK